LYSLATTQSGRQKRAEGQRRYRQKQLLPELLIAMALMPLPNRSSFFFQQALESANNLDESGLDEWDKPPPYQSLPSPDSPSEQQYTLRLIDVLNGRRLRIYREDAKSRKLLSGKGATSDLQRAISEHVEEWHNLGGLLKDYAGCERHRSIGKNLHEWHARWAYYMNQELVNLKSP
jgi:hypothetical protein